jgi:diadenosine tetraphosphate (Ap4A) HIT family hydrolase
MAIDLDARLLAGSHPIVSLALCEARLQDDARFPWIVLIPRRTGAVEIADLAPEEQAALWGEVAAAGAAVRSVGQALGRPPLKLNHGQLGNVVAQLHIHVVGRHPGDAAWPGPVWGAGTAVPYAAAELEAALTAGRSTFGV